MRFTVNRQFWRCGGSSASKHGKGLTRLHNEEGYLCCLGFATEACGIVVSPKIETPAGTEKLFFLTKTSMFGVQDNRLAQRAMSINDDNISREAREKQLTELFKESGHEIEFTGDYCS